MSFWNSKPKKDENLSQPKNQEHSVDGAFGASENAFPGSGSKKFPVKDYMTRQPQTINADETVARAGNLMLEKGFRHLPVVKGKHLIGILSDRDIKSALSQIGADPTRMKVSEACTLEPYAPAPDTPLEEVCREMARHRYGSAMVMENDKVIGIFTTVDACRILSEFARERAGRE